MNLQQYLYEYMQNGGRNPSVLKKFTTYLEMNNVEITEYPRVLEQFLEELPLVKTTKRNYKTSCNQFLTYVYAREGVVIPNKTQTLKEQEKHEEAVRIENDTITIKSTATIKEVKQYTTLTRNENSNTGKEKQKPYKHKQEQEEEVIMDEEYREFLRKYERLCENG